MKVCHNKSETFKKVYASNRCQSQSTNVNAGGNQTVVVSSPGTFINRPTTLNTQAETFTYKVKIAKILL